MSNPILNCTTASLADGYSRRPHCKGILPDTLEKQDAGFRRPAQILMSCSIGLKNEELTTTNLSLLIYGGSLRS